MIPSKRDDSFPVWAILSLGVMFSAMWSSAFPVAKILVATVPAFSVSAVRFIFASIIAGILALVLGQKVPKTASAWKSILVLGLCQNTLFIGLGFTAITRIPAGIAAIIASTTPLVIAALAPVFASERVGTHKLIGLVVGFAGVVWMMSFRISAGMDLFGLFLAMMGVLAFSTATLTVRRGEFGTGLLMVVSAQMMVGGLACIPMAILFDTSRDYLIAVETVYAFLYLVLISGICATLIWFFLIKHITAASASSFHFLNPIFGIVFSYFLLGETVSGFDLLGVALVAVGIWIVNTYGDNPVAKT